MIYQENWSFDGLYGKFPGANNLSCANTYQVYKNDSLMHGMLHPLIEDKSGKWFADPKFKNDTIIAGRPYNLASYISVDSFTGDITHRFYTEQLQIDNGKMDKYAVYSENPGLVQSYFDATNMPEGLLAQQYTLCDNFFHSAFGGSFLNHIWLIAAATPEWKSAPYDIICMPNDTNLAKYDNQITTDGYAVNTTNSINKPHPSWDKYLMPNLKMPTIGDRLNDAAGISWAWYSGGWNNALSTENPDPLFQCHHQRHLFLF